MRLPAHRSTRVVRLTGITVGGVILVLAGAYLAGIRINLTASFPVGLWRLTPGPAHVGDLVFFRADPHHPVIRWAMDIGTLPPGFGRGPVLLKRIVAGPGDVITLTDAVRINGQAVPHGHISQHDAAGRPIPATAVAGPVPAEAWWMMSDQTDRSLDSRYFGAVPQSAVLGRAVPLWLW